MDRGPEAPGASEGYYAHAYRFRPVNVQVYAEILRYLTARHGGPWRSVLDLGAGYGYFINQVDAPERWAIDAEPAFAGHIATGVKTIVADVTDVARHFAPASIHLVFASNLFEHLTLEAGETVLRAVRSLLTADGALVAVQPNFRTCSERYFDDYTHRTVYDHESFAQLLRVCGFGRIAVEPRFLPYSSRGMGSFAQRLPVHWLVRAYLALPGPLRPNPGQMLIVARS